MNRKYLLIHSGVILFTFLISLVLSPQLPDNIAIHWNISGEADGYASKYFAIFFMPFLMTILMLAITIIPVLKFVKADIERFSETYYLLSTVKLVFLAYIQMILIRANLEQSFDLNKFVLGGIALLCIFVGNYLPKVKKNQLIGIRTPWTLSNEHIWFSTHRLAGKLLTISSFIVFIGAFSGLPMIAGIGILIISLIIPAIYSYAMYKRDSK